VAKEASGQGFLRLFASLALVAGAVVTAAHVPLLARNVLHQDADGFGFLMAALGVGAVSGALTIGGIRRSQPPLPLTFTAAVLACMGILALAFVRRFWVAVPGLFRVGFFAVVVTASCNTTLQINAPDDLRGRVMSLYSLVFGGSVPLGALLGGFISQHWGVPTAFLVMGATGLARPPPSSPAGGPGVAEPASFTNHASPRTAELNGPTPRAPVPRIVARPTAPG